MDTQPPEILANILANLTGGDLLRVRVSHLLRDLAMRMVRPIRDTGEAIQAVLRNDLISLCYSRGVDWAVFYKYTFKEKYYTLAKAARARVTYWAPLINFVPDGRYDESMHQLALRDGAVLTEKALRNIGQYLPQVAYDMIITALTGGSDPDTYEWLYYGLCIGGHLGYIKSLFDFNDGTDKLATFDCSIEFVARSGNGELLEFIIEQTGTNEDTWNEVLFGAAEAGLMSMAEYAISKGADAYDSGLLIACKDNYFEIEALMLEHEIINPIHLLSHSRYMSVEICMELLRRALENIEPNDMQGALDVILACAYSVENEDFAIQLELMGAQAPDAKKFFLLSRYRLSEITDLTFINPDYYRQVREMISGRHTLEEFVHESIEHELYFGYDVEFYTLKNTDRIADYIHSLNYEYIHGAGDEKYFDICVPALKLFIILTDVEEAQFSNITSFTILYIWADDDYEKIIDTYILGF